MGLSFGWRVGDTLDPRPSSEVSWSVDFDDTFLTTAAFSVFWTAALLFLKLKDGGLGLVGEGVASSVGTEGGEPLLTEINEAGEGAAISMECEGDNGDIILPGSEGCLKRKGTELKNLLQDS